MQLQILLNLLIAFVWMFFQTSWNVTTFFIGLVIGGLILYVLRRFFNQPFYLSKTLPVLRLMMLFIRELIVSSLIVLREIMRPTLNIHPGIVAVPTELKSDWELTTLACLVSLTPGTLSLEVSPDQDVLYVHAMDIDDSEAAIKQIKSTFEKAIMEVSR